MKLIWVALFSVSLLGLLILLLRRPLSRLSLKKVIVHWVFAATFLFLLHEFDFTRAYALPINPLTVGTTAILGLPGLVLMIGIRQFVI